MKADEIINIDLSPDERRILMMGIAEWAGPARCTEEMAVAMGFQNVTDLFNQGERIRDVMAAGSAMSRRDWCRCLLATEIVFASDILGSGSDWRITTGVSDSDTIVLLRNIQRKVTREVAGLIGNGLGTRPRPSLDDKE